MPGGQNPPLFAVATDDPALEIPGAFGFDGLLETLLDDRPILGHDVLQKHLEGPLRQERFVAEDLIVAQRPVRRVVDQVQVPVTHFNDIQGEARAPVAFVQRIGAYPQLPAEPQNFRPPDRTDTGSRAQEKDADHGGHLPDFALQRRKRFRDVHLGDQKPGRVRDMAQRGQHRYAPIVHPLDDSCLTQDGFGGRKSTTWAERTAHHEGRVRTKAKVVQKEGLVALAPDQQCLGACGRHRPFLDKRKKILGRVNAQIDDAQRPAGVQVLEKRNQHLHIDAAVAFVPEQVLEADLV